MPNNPKQNMAEKPAKKLAEMPPKKHKPTAKDIVREIMPLIIQRMDEGYHLDEIYNEIKGELPRKITLGTFTTYYRETRKEMADSGVPGIKTASPGRPPIRR